MARRKKFLIRDQELAELVEPLLDSERDIKREVGQLLVTNRGGGWHIYLQGGNGLHALDGEQFSTHAAALTNAMANNEPVESKHIAEPYRHKFLRRLEEDAP